MIFSNVARNALSGAAAAFSLSAVALAAASTRGSLCSSASPRTNQRWRKLAVSASKQCGRSDITEVQDIQKFYFFTDRLDRFDLGIMACLSEETASLREAVSEFKGGNIVLFIGPEGDFTPEEIEMARNAHCKLVSLGSLVLRSDTAAVAALSILKNELSR